MGLVDRGDETFEPVPQLGFTQKQARLLDFIDHLGNNEWDRNSQTDAVMPSVLAEVAEVPARGCWRRVVALPSCF
jgi:hypothetical protein